MLQRGSEASIIIGVGGEKRTPTEKRVAHQRQELMARCYRNPFCQLVPLKKYLRISYDRILQKESARI